MLQSAIYKSKSFIEHLQQKVILVDWRKGAEGPKYATAARNVDMLARVSAELIYRLIKKYSLQVIYRRDYLKWITDKNNELSFLTNSLASPWWWWC